MEIPLPFPKLHGAGIQPIGWDNCSTSSWGWNPPHPPTSPQSGVTGERFKLDGFLGDLVLTVSILGVSMTLGV